MKNRKDLDPLNGEDLNKSDVNGVRKVNANGKEHPKSPSEADSLYLNLLNKPPTINIVGPLFRAFWQEFLITGSFRLFAMCVQFLNPLLLDYLLTHISEPNVNKWEGISYGVGMFTVMFVFSLANNQHEFRISVLAMKIRSALTMAIYQKTLLLSSTGRNVYATGEIVNLMSSDCERIFEFITSINQAW